MCKYGNLIKGDHGNCIDDECEVMKRFRDSAAKIRTAAQLEPRLADEEERAMVKEK